MQSNKDTGTIKACLPSLGNYVNFNTQCIHHGYKSGTVQLFAAPTGRINKTGKNNKPLKPLPLERGNIKGDQLSSLNSISNAI